MAIKIVDLPEYEMVGRILLLQPPFPYIGDDKSRMGIAVRKKQDKRIQKNTFLNWITLW